MKVHFGGRLFLAAAALGAAAVLVLGLLVALGGRSVVAGPGAGPASAAPTPVGHEWSQVEGHGTGTGLWWLGTTVDQSLELRVNNARALRLEPNATSPNVIGGYSGNTVTPGVAGAAIGGGGSSGNTNRVTDDGGTVGGGANNQAGDSAGTTTDRLYATVGGGTWNTASASYSSVGGGYGNYASGQWATVSGGVQNGASAQFTAIGGGLSNIATVDGATVGGGSTNTASGQAATVSGGWYNTASNKYATVAGGQSNTASDQDAVVGGGYNNWAGEPYATVGGGLSNTANGWYATVPGGNANTANGTYSFAAGRQAKANHQGAFVWADSTAADFASERDNQFRVRADGGARLDVNNSEWVEIRDDGTNLINTSAGAPGARLTIGGVWTDASSRDGKENFTPVDGQEVLASLADVPITTWNSKSQDASVRHMGPTAQDFSAAFGLGEDDLHIAALDSSGVALAAIQALYTLSQEQAARIGTLEEENAGLQQRLDDLDARVTALEGGAPLDRGSSAGPLASIMPGGWLLLGALLVLGGLVLAQRRLAGGRS